MARVLVVEDSPTQAAHLCATLEEAGLEVIAAPDAERALELLERESFDLVISDIVMPGKSGYDLCRQIKLAMDLRTLPVMLLSQLNEPMDIIRGLECGADNFLTKPYRAEQLVDRVTMILANRSLRATGPVIGIDIMFLGKRFTITSEKEQILDLLISTFEDTVQANRDLQRHRSELAVAKMKLEEYAHALEGRVRHEEEKYALLMENANTGILITDVNAVILEANREMATILGLPLGEIVGRKLGEFVNSPTFPGNWSRVLVEGSVRIDHVRVQRADEGVVWINAASSRVHVGDLDVVQVIWHDVTQQVLLEEQLRHAQRMEAMGQLTGGLAHDFNNLLGVIIGNLDVLVSRDLGDAKEYAENAVEAALRGANLIRQLLAFARKQPLTPESIRVEERLPMTARLLESTLGANITVQCRVEPDVYSIVADVAQLESAILNLAVNARDAMPSGGTLTIECANADLDETYTRVNTDVTPGKYLEIAVSDNGSGMTAEVRARVFDPFFTTKGAKGTGLGLSQVFGFVKQSGGHVKIYSEVGIGTTLRLYLPAANAPASRVEIEERAVEGAAANETILLVEDDLAMREIAATQIRALGYALVVADNPARALDLLRSEMSVDLLLTDIVMPGGLDGRQLAIEARRLRPDLNVLFSSGFTEAAVSASINRDFGPILTKPYRKSDLARRIRSAIGSTSN